MLAINGLSLGLDFTGGILLEFFNWGSIFLLAVPVLVPLLILGPWLLPESEPDASGPMDVISIVLSMVALSALVYSIKHVASEGPDAWGPGRAPHRGPVPAAGSCCAKGSAKRIENPHEGTFV